jgi:hypothetical protein
VNDPVPIPIPIAIPISGTRKPVPGNRHPETGTRKPNNWTSPTGPACSIRLDVSFQKLDPAFGVYTTGLGGVLAFTIQ